MFEAVVLVCDIEERNQARELDIALFIRLRFLWNKAVRVLPNRIELQISNALDICVHMAELCILFIDLHVEHSGLVADTARVAEIGLQPISPTTMTDQHLHFVQSDASLPGME